MMTKRFPIILHGAGGSTRGYRDADEIPDEHIERLLSAIASVTPGNAGDTVGVTLSPDGHAREYLALHAGGRATWTSHGGFRVAGNPDGRQVVEWRAGLPRSVHLRDLEIDEQERLLRTFCNGNLEALRSLSWIPGSGDA